MHNFGADALVGENLEQQAVRQATVDEVHALHALLQGAYGAGHLGAHALVDDAAALQVVDLADLIAPDHESAGNDDADILQRHDLFTAAQLTDLNGFLATPTGALYANEWMALQADPEVMVAVVKAIPPLITKFIDRAPELGGTWYYNGYPGAACDVPSHLYSFSFDQRRDWERLCPTRDDILGYLRDSPEAFERGLAPPSAPDLPEWGAQGFFLNGGRASPSPPSARL